MEDLEKTNRKKAWRSILSYVILKNVMPFVVFFFYSIYAIYKKVINSEVNADISSFHAISILISLIIILAVIGFRMYREKLKEDFKKLNRNNILFSVLVLLLTITLSGIINIFLKTETVDNQKFVLDMLDKSAIFTFLSAVILAPIIEEIIFRMNIKTLIKNETTFLIISTLIFGFLHSYFDIINGYRYYLLGLALAIVYLKTDNIVCCISTHFLNNLLGVLLAMYMYES